MSMVNRILTSLPATEPLTASSPMGDLNMPSSLSASCLSVSRVVFGPCGETMVTSQSPATFVAWANAGPASVSAAIAATTVNSARFMKTSPGRSQLRPLHRLFRGAPGRQWPLAQFADGCRASDGVAADFPLHRDVHQFSVVRDGPRDRDFAALQASVERKLAVLVDHRSGEMGARLIDDHVDALRPGRHHEGHSPFA